MTSLQQLQPKTIFLNAPAISDGENHRLALYDWQDNYNNGQEASAGETIFCIHGLTRNGRDFDSLSASLIADGAPRRVLCLDVVGRGKSQWLSDPAGYNYAQYVADTIAVINQLNLSNLHFVGTSMGGIIGMLLANHAPHLLKTITINDIGCFIPAAGLRRIAEYVGKASFASRAEAEAALRARCCCYGIRDEIHWQQMFTHSIETCADGSFRLAYDTAIAQIFGKPEEIADVDLWNLWEGVKKIPTLLIRGADSDILPRDVAEKMQSTHPNLSLLEIAGVGHAPALADGTQISAIKHHITQHASL